MNKTNMILQNNLARVEEEIQASCDRVDKPRQSVTMIAVTKTVSSEIAEQLLELGITKFGESRPQELWKKKEALSSKDIHWHMIGHLQTNKIDKTMPLVELIHSVDRLRLINALESFGQSQGLTIQALLEVNASREANKHGFTPEELPSLIDQFNDLQHVSIQGLMTMAAFEEDIEKCRPTFQLLRQLRDDLQSSFSEQHSLTELSMGMSNDYPIAIEEGATWIRIGSALFEGLIG